MENKRQNFFWPSYVDLMTGLFAVMLVLFALTYVHFKKETEEKNKQIKIAQEQAQLLRKVQANMKLFKSAPDVFNYNEKYNRIELTFNIEFKTGFDYYQIRPQDLLSNYSETKDKLDILGKRLRSIINTFLDQKKTDTSMRDISYLMVISGTASNLNKGRKYSEEQNKIANYRLSYDRALFLYKYLCDSLQIDFDSKLYHQIIELQISGMGFGGIGRSNEPYDPHNFPEEQKNQRFIISIAPKIGIPDDKPKKK